MPLIIVDPDVTSGGTSPQPSQSFVNIFIAPETSEEIIVQGDIIGSSLMVSSQDYVKINGKPICVNGNNGVIASDTTNNTFVSIA